MQWLALMYVTCRLGVMTEPVVQFELMERGISKDMLMIINLFLTPLEVCTLVYCCRVCEHMCGSDCGLVTWFFTKLHHHPKHSC